MPTVRAEFMRDHGWFGEPSRRQRDSRQL